jgi:hypothetical protein
VTTDKMELKILRRRHDELAIASACFACLAFIFAAHYQIRTLCDEQ